jgi:phosphoribosylformylglycinamidine cyclo-ligase
MPGFYADGEYDVAGFIVGVVERSRIVDGRRITQGDVLIALPSSGLHTNGYSLARRVFFDVCGWTPSDVVPELGQSLGDALLTTHRSYLRTILPLIDAGLVKGMAHITGGGITENLPRVLPPGFGAQVDRGAWEVPAVFQLLRSRGRIPDDEMFRAFNMGIGLIVVCAAADRDRAMSLLAQGGESGTACIGRIVAGDRDVRYLP